MPVFPDIAMQGFDLKKCYHSYYTIYYRALDSFFFLSWSHEYIIWSQMFYIFLIQHFINQCMLINFYHSL